VALDALLAEMRALRDRVVGITDTALASRDGLIIVADTVDINPDNVAALAAASLGVAQRITAEAGKGSLREATMRGSGGCVAIYAVNASALLLVIGDEGLDSTRLHLESRSTVEALDKLLAGPGATEAAAS
jgi:predicted regulator of Ras-like GTPase activity (Roadblock/LC7/MglB family)